MEASCGGSPAATWPGVAAMSHSRSPQPGRCPGVGTHRVPPPRRGARCRARVPSGCQDGRWHSVVARHRSGAGANPTTQLWGLGGDARCLARLRFARGKVWQDPAVPGAPSTLVRTLGEQGAEQGQRQHQGCRQERGWAGPAGVAVAVARPALPRQLLEGDGLLQGRRALQGRLHLRGDKVGSCGELGSPCAAPPRGTLTVLPRVSLCPPTSPSTLVPRSAVRPHVPAPPRAPLTSSTFLKTRSRLSASAALTSCSVQPLRSSSATSAG